MQIQEHREPIPLPLGEGADRMQTQKHREPVPSPSGRGLG